MSVESMAPSDKAAALTHLIAPWVSTMSDEMLCRLKTPHGGAERLFEAILWVANNTHVPLSEIDYGALREAVEWTINAHYDLRKGMSEEDKS